MLDVTGALVGGVGVLEVEVVVAGLDLVDGDLPRLLVLDAVVPPLAFGRELLEADRLGLVVLFTPGGLIPDFGGRPALGEEEQVGLDAGVGGEDALRQADDGVAVGEVDLLADLRQPVPPGGLEGRGDELGPDVSLGEGLLVHGEFATPRKHPGDAYH